VLGIEQTYRDLADECQRLAATSFSTQCETANWRMAESYGALAVTRELGIPGYGD